jgi:hypothetical protein
MNEVSLHRQRHSELPASLPPRGLSRVQAAEYVGVSASTFDKRVTDGDMPAPKRSGERVIWDLDSGVLHSPPHDRGLIFPPAGPLLARAILVAMKIETAKILERKASSLSAATVAVGD